MIPCIPSFTAAWPRAFACQPGSLLPGGNDLHRVEIELLQFGYGLDERGVALILLSFVPLRLHQVDSRPQYPVKFSVRMSLSLTPAPFTTACRPLTICGGPAM